MTVGERLKNLRLKNGLTQEKVAEAIGYTHKSAVAKIETNKRDLTQRKLEQFASFYGVSPNFLLGYEDEERSEGACCRMRIKELIKNSGKTQKMIAKDLGITPNSLCNYSAGTREPDHEMLIKIAKYFNVSVDYLLGNDSEQSTTACVSDNLLTEQEKVLLKHFRETTEEGRFRMIAAVLEVENKLI